MSLLPARLQINDAPFPLREPEPRATKVVPAIARMDREAALQLDREATAALSSNLAPQSSNPPALSSKPTVKQSLPVADPDGWIPHDGGPCPVEGKAKVLLKFRCGQVETESSQPAGSWRWIHISSGFDITAYKLATPPEPVKTAHAGEFLLSSLEVQQHRQQRGLPVEWDKVPVGSKVWVRDEDFEEWRLAAWRALKENASIAPYPYGAENEECGVWAQCKLHIEGVAP